MKDDGWIEWHGGDCPVPKGTLIDVRYRDGEVSYGVMALFDTLPMAGQRWATNWGHSKHGFGADIVGYRVCAEQKEPPAEPPAPDTSAEDALWNEYAGKAMQGFLARDEIFVDMRAGLDAFACGAADMADAMLAEARKRGRV